MPQRRSQISVNANRMRHTQGGKGGMAMKTTNMHSRFRHAALRGLAALAALLCLAQPALAAPASGQSVALTAADGIVELADGARIDLDGDGALETVTYRLVSDDDFMGEFTVRAGGAELTVETCDGLERLYAGRLSGDSDGVYLLVGERGPSDDPCAYILRYSAGALTNIGSIPALPADIAINGAVLTATVRANALQTWFRESDFVIARLARFDEDYEPLPEEYYVAESPRARYPMDTAVVLKRDLPLTLAPAGGDGFTLSAGERAILTATDDLTYVYVVPVDRAAHDWLPGGYLALADYVNVLIDGEPVMAGDVFDGLIFAD